MSFFLFNAKIEPKTSAELQKTLKQLKNKRTGGGDGLVAEMLRTGHADLLTATAAHFTHILYGKLDPSTEWKTRRGPLTPILLAIAWFWWCGVGGAVPSWAQALPAKAQKSCVEDRGTLPSWLAPSSVRGNLKQLLQLFLFS